MRILKDFEVFLKILEDFWRFSKTISRFWRILEDSFVPRTGILENSQQFRWILENRGRLIGMSDTLPALNRYLIDQLSIPMNHLICI